jgi:broad specificity phosphatase PhoE
LLGQRIVVAKDAHVAVVPELQEIHFGEWELRNWEDIFAEVPDALDRMIAEPTTYAAPGGETLWSVRDRVMGWYDALPDRGLIVAVTHGGPIAVLRGTLGGFPVDKWFTLVTNHGEIIELESR